MIRFVGLNNGTIRRVRGTFGGNQAWKQHDDGERNPSERNRLIARIEDELAREQLREAMADRRSGRPSRNGQKRWHKPSARHEQRQEHRLGQRPAQHVDAAEAPVVVKPAPRIKVVISESGTMRAVKLN